MTDTVEKDIRSQIMSKVRGKDTAPEMLVRRLVFHAGYRYRLRGRLPGKPDLVFTSRRKVIFVHGCFWHRHSECPLARMPKSRIEFWQSKLEKNRLRDIRNQEKLEALGWRVLVLWECELRDTEEVLRKIHQFLD